MELTRWAEPKGGLRVGRGSLPLAPLLKVCVPDCALYLYASVSARSCICVCVCMRVHICFQICVRSHLREHVCLSVFVCVCVSCVCACVCMCACTTHSRLGRLPVSKCRVMGQSANAGSSRRSRMNHVFLPAPPICGISSHCLCVCVCMCVCVCVCMYACMYIRIVCTYDTYDTYVCMIGMYVYVCM